MSTLNYRNAYLAINGTDLSAHVESLALNYKSEMLDETAMGDSSRIRKGGLKDWSIDVSFNQDFASGGPDGTLFSLVGTTACVEVRPQNICSTASNPTFSGIGVIETYNPLGGAVGTLLKAPLTIQSASDLSRASSS